MARLPSCLTSTCLACRPWHGSRRCQDWDMPLGELPGDICWQQAMLVSPKAAYPGKGDCAAAEPIVLTCSCNWRSALQTCSALKACCAYKAAMGALMRQTARSVPQGFTQLGLCKSTCATQNMRRCDATMTTASSTAVHAPMQIRCGDLYNDQAIQTFNACAVSDKKCVPQRVDQKFKVPKDEDLDKNFDLNMFQASR